MQTPPHDIDVERSLLVTLIMGDPRETGLLMPRLSEPCFMHPSHREVFTAMTRMVSRGVPLDSLGIWQEMVATGRSGRIEGFPWLVDMVRSAEEVERPDILVETLNTLRHRRELIHLAGHLTAQAFDPTSDPSEVIHEAQSGLHRVSLDGKRDDGESWEEILHSMASHERFRNAGPDSMGKWGIPTLDLLAPIPAGEYVTIGARPGVGKTALMTQVAVESAEMGIKTLVVTMELSRVSMRARLASYMAKLPVSDLKRGNYGSVHTNSVANEYQTALLAGRIQSPSPGIPWAKLDAMIRYEVDRYGVQLVLLDQFDKIGRNAVGRGSSEAYAFGQVSTGIMALTKELGIGFVLLCQLKGDAEGREPTLADHADSDRPGKDPAVVVHLWRDKDNNVKAKIQKNRDGGFVNKRISLDFDGSCQRFVEVEQTTETNSQCGAWSRV